jgi:hypothetical protein
MSKVIIKTHPYMFGYTIFCCCSLYTEEEAAGHPVVDGQALQFKYNPKKSIFVDTQTGNEWNFEGVAREGAYSVAV